MSICFEATVPIHYEDLIVMNLWQAGKAKDHKNHLAINDSFHL